jgi:hypothetical protein
MNIPTDPVTETAIAAQEIAKATGKVVDASREAGGFIAKVIAGPLEQGMGIFEDRLKYMRWERQVRFIQRSNAVMNELGLIQPTKQVPLKLAIPLFVGASLEDDDGLQDRWVNLLVNTVNAESGVEIRRVHLEILEQIGSVEAQILDSIYDLPFDQSRTGGVIVSGMPISVRFPTTDSSEYESPSGEIELALANLARLGCVLPIRLYGSGESFGRVNQTILGHSFVRACRIQRP